MINNIIKENEKLKMIYEKAYNFLKSKADKDALKKELDYYIRYKPQTINDVFKQMIQSLKNKQGYNNYIADIQQMDTILLNYEPTRIVAKFGNNWGKLFGEFKSKFGQAYTMNKDNKRNAWVMYSKGVISCSTFLTNFRNVEEFDEFVKSFFHNEFTIVALPMLLEKEIYGFGFPLACDFLKELGYIQYGKPDVHLKEIFKALKLVELDSDYEIFKKIVKIGIIVGQAPVIVDKVFWLIGSGKFPLSGIKIGSKKSEFIEFIQSKLNNIPKN